MKESNYLSDAIDTIKNLAEKVYRPYRDTVLLCMLVQEVASCKTGLDYGCGDGIISKNIQDITGCIFQGVETVIRETAEIPTTKISPEQTPLPFEDDAFDCVMFIDVLHHTKDYLTLLREAARLAKKKIIIKDHYYDSQAEYWRLCIADFAGNAIYGVNLPFNFLTLERWKETLSQLDNVKISKQETFELGGPDICKHILIVLEKSQPIN